eukprot:m.258240 g.258240  ORF g.258240 m.258240 type:complete len:655 (+) comp21391_c0_seq1:3-1967(+)
MAEPTNTPRRQRRTPMRFSEPGDAASPSKRPFTPWSIDEIRTFLSGCHRAAENDDWTSLTTALPGRQAAGLRQCFTKYRYIIDSPAVEPAHLIALFDSDEAARAAAATAPPTPTTVPSPRVAPAMTDEEARVAESLFAMSKAAPVGTPSAAAATNSPRPTPAREPASSAKPPKNRELFPTASTPRRAADAESRTPRAAKRPAPTPVQPLPELDEALPPELFELRGHLETVFRHAAQRPQFARWAAAEWFYSSLDQCILRDNSQFERRLSEAVPEYIPGGLMTRAQWTALRRRLPRPRRLSPAMLAAERAALAAQRDYIRDLQRGRQPGAADPGVTERVPLMLSVGQQVVVRLSTRDPARSHYLPGWVAVVCSASNAYRVKLNRPDLGIRQFADSDVMALGDYPCVPVSALLRERVHVPSAGIMDRPRRRPSVVPRDKMASPTTPVPDLQYTELVGRQDISETATERQKLEALIARIVTTTGEVGSAVPDAEARLALLVRRALQCKELLLREQAQMNAWALESAARREQPHELALQWYDWITHYLAQLDRAVATALAVLPAAEPSEQARDVVAETIRSAWERADSLLARAPGSKGAAVARDSLAVLCAVEIVRNLDAPRATKAAALEAVMATAARGAPADGRLLTEVQTLLARLV